MRQIPPLGPDRPGEAPRLRDLACRLTALAARGPVDVTVAGPAALDGLGFLPAWRRAEVWLTGAEEEALPGPLPSGLEVRRPGD